MKLVKLVICWIEPPWRKEAASSRRRYFSLPNGQSQSEFLDLIIPETFGPPELPLEDFISDRGYQVGCQDPGRSTF